jgi:hypothetical protein
MDVQVRRIESKALENHFQTEGKEAQQTENPWKLGIGHCNTSRLAQHFQAGRASRYPQHFPHVKCML